jgi:hypothetical protein
MLLRWKGGTSFLDGRVPRRTELRQNSSSIKKSDNIGSSVTRGFIALTMLVSPKWSTYSSVIVPRDPLLLLVVVNMNLHGRSSPQKIFGLM